MKSISILPKNFKDLLEIFYDAEFQTEEKFGRFRLDFYCPKLNVAFEYDGIQHYSVIQKIESDKRKSLLLNEAGIQLFRWPYYFMPTRDVCLFVFKELFDELKFQQLLSNILKVDNETDILSPGFHSTTNIPANFIWPGVDRFLSEMESAPKSLRHQIRHSLKLYCKHRAGEKEELVIPTYHDGFMQFYSASVDPSLLGVQFKNG